MTEPLGPVSLIHAFSRRNAGDGLLVDLTIAALGEAGIPRSECQVLALDADSFPDIASLKQVPGEPAARFSWRLAGAAVELARSAFGSGRVEEILTGSRAIVAVGGGYLVADSFTRQAGVMLNHFAQLHAAAAMQRPTVYLPQSIGPLPGGLGQLVRSRLAKIDRIWVRDDQTLTELGLPNVRRCPDLAVMKLGLGFSKLQPATSEGPPIIVARSLPHAGTLVPRLRALHQALPEALFAVQAETEGHRSDREFYRKCGFHDGGRLGQLLESPSGPVVSVRLHGAIAALLAGRPAIHLAYERKGWGAFGDLGLDEFCHDAREFDPALVANQLRSLVANPANYWQSVAEASDRLASAWADMVRDLSTRLGTAVSEVRER